MKQTIGERQRWAWLAAGLSAAAATGVCGYGWLWVLLGGLAAAGYYIIMDQAVPPEGIANLYGRLGRGGKILLCLTGLWTVLVLSWTACLADAAFPMMDGFPGLGWALLALTAWGGQKGSAACARCGGVLCLFLLVLYGIIGIFAVPDVRGTYLLPGGQWQESVWTLGLFLLPAGVWFVPCTRSRKGPAWQMAFLLPLFGAFLAAVTAGVLSPELAARRTVPLYDLAKSVSIFGVVERIEPLLSAAMTMGVFSLMSSLVCSGQAIGEPLGISARSGIVICALAGVGMYLVRSWPAEWIASGSAIFWLAIPALVMIFSPREEKRL